eukprot:NODE_152_length_16986_cov_0.478119.p9 type:complete len:289 gc:universal NODE_152_length_16986_cov_0.478119:4052-3186(-)
MSKTARSIVKVIKGNWQAEGAGAKVIRSVGSQGFSRCDPFLMLDEFFVTGNNGFPAHPHRGFETLTYMLEGEFEHEDFMGNRGKITPGSIQYMTAGKGIVHSEQPCTENAHGLQLWINLPASRKMIEPSYQDRDSSQISKTVIGDASINVIAGSANGVDASVYTQTPMMYLDVLLNGSVKLPVRNDFNGFVYIIDGKCTVNNVVYDAHNTLVLDSAGSDTEVGVLSVSSTTTCRFVLVAGKPINEPIAQHGPFVMNTQKELEEAFADFHGFKNGFEKNKGFKAAIDSK